MRIDDFDLITNLLEEIVEDSIILKCIHDLLENQRKRLTERIKEDNLRKICLEYSKKWINKEEIEDL